MNQISTLPEALPADASTAVTGALTYIRPQSSKPYFHSSSLTGDKPRFFFDSEVRGISPRDLEHPRVRVDRGHIAAALREVKPEPAAPGSKIEHVPPLYRGQVLIEHGYLVALRTEMHRGRPPEVTVTAENQDFHGKSKKALHFLSPGQNRFGGSATSSSSSSRRPLSSRKAVNSASVMTLSRLDLYGLSTVSLTTPS